MKIVNIAEKIFEILWIQTKIVPPFDISDESQLNKCS